MRSLATAIGSSPSYGSIRSLTFADSGLILPRLGNEGLPVRTVNLDKVHVEIARIHDRNLIAEVRNGNFNASWDYRTAAIVAVIPPAVCLLLCRIIPIGQSA